MRRLLSGTVFRLMSAAALAAFVFSCSSENASRSDADVAVAEVEGARISLIDLKNEIAARRGLTPSLSAKSASGGEVREALRALIDRAVVLSEAQRLGIHVEGSEVEREVERYRADFPQGGLEKALLQAGMDMDGWKASLSRSLLYRKAAEAIADSRVTVTEAEVEAVFRRKAGRISRPERIRVRQFLFPSEESARDARRSIQEGEPPEEILRRFSAGDVRPTVAELGEVTREDLPPEIAAELFMIPDGGVGGIVPREESYSIFQVIRKEAAGVPTLAAAAPGIREELQRARREEAFRSWLAAQVGKARIRIHEAVLDRLTGGEKS
ncbi:MAG TPA: peptidylprolyl isomerase [Candidatus Deferrimicrobiaceae bacterium]